MVVAHAEKKSNKCQHLMIVVLAKAWRRALAYEVRQATALAQG
jgi:hypothetical protein